MIDPLLTFDAGPHRYFYDGKTAPNITLVLGLTGFVNSEWFNPRATERGTDTHRACLQLVEGTLDWEKLDPEITPRVKQFYNFLNDYNPDFLFGETPLYSKAFGFAGTMDFLFIMAGKPTIIEVKTGIAGLAAKLQTAAQKQLIEENMAFKGIQRYAFELSGVGSYKFVPHTTDMADKVMFLNALAMVNRRINEGELKI